MVCVDNQHAAKCHWLEHNSRLHLQHGPIDLILQADGDESERVLAFKQATAFFDSVLIDLVAELAYLRKPVSQLVAYQFQLIVANHMHRAVTRFATAFITPMAAVAGSVADCTLAAMCRGRKLDSASINNGGDIAVHLSAGNSVTLGVCESPLSHSQYARARISAESCVRGIATSGWHGRSHSLGIADAVTVLASNAALADAAATLIANKVDLPGSSKVVRIAAKELAPDSDLGNRQVTVDVQPLSLPEKQQALCAGHLYAQSLVSEGLIDSAYMALQGQRIVAGQHHSHPLFTDRRQIA